MNSRDSNRLIDEFLKHNPHANRKEIEAFAKEYGIEISFGGGVSDEGIDDPSYGNLSYTEDDFK